MIDSDKIKQRIYELKKMKKDELIDLILDLESNNDLLKQDNENLEQKNEELRKERNTALLEKDDYREKYFKSVDQELIMLKQYKHNARGAGRKAKFTDEQIQEIRNKRAEGKSIRAIAEEFSCSVGLVHKLINEYKENK